MATSAEMEIEAIRPGQPDGLASDAQCGSMLAVESGDASEAEPTDQVWWRVASTEGTEEAVETQHVAEMLLRARRMSVVGSSAPCESGLRALMEDPTSAVLAVADKAVSKLEEESKSAGGGCELGRHHDTSVGYVVADALGFELLSATEAESFGSEARGHGQGSSDCEGESEKKGGSTEGAGRCD